MRGNHPFVAKGVRRSESEKACEIHPSLTAEAIAPRRI